MYVVGRALSKPRKMSMQQVKDYQNHAKCVYTRQKSFKITLNVFVVVKKISKSC